MTERERQDERNVRELDAEGQKKTSWLVFVFAFLFVNATAAQTAQTDPYEVARANADRQAKEWIARRIPAYL